MQRLLLIFALIASFASWAKAQETPGYVGSQACFSCHEREANAWEKSHHALAWTHPGPDTIVANFDGTSFEHDGMIARFRIEDDTYRVSVTEKDGTTTDHRIHSVAGIEPLQQYLIETEGGRIQSFDVAWDTERKRWFHLYPDQDLPPEDGLHWTGPYKNWNARCAECHATGFKKNYDPATNTYASTEAEIGVGCEACHGPGKAHVAWAENRAPLPAGTADALGLAVAFGTRDATIEQCAGCHSRREAFGDGNPVPGTPFHDAYNLSLLRPGLYHADGQILDEVYVFGSFLQSKMNAAGVSCLDCHDAHSARLKADGNAVCTQCHNPAGNPRFPTLVAADYDSPAHHFHEPGTAGAACASCHMIERIYMGVDGRRDHSFRVPRPDLSAATGAPNACTDCHAERDAEWAAARVAEWYPKSRNRGAHYGEVLAAGRADVVGNSNAIAGLAADTRKPAIVRATAVELLERLGDPTAAEVIAPLLADPDPLVRAAAVRLQRSAPPPDRATRVLPLLSDPAKSVRMAAAEVLLQAPVARLPENAAQALRTAIGEWQGSMANRLDFPETHLKLGGMALVMRNIAEAEAAFREVVQLDPQHPDAWIMLARIAAATRGSGAARAVIEEALSHNSRNENLRAMAEQLEQAR